METFAHHPTTDTDREGDRQDGQRDLQLIIRENFSKYAKFICVGPGGMLYVTS